MEANRKNWPLLGNKHIVEFISRSISKGSVAGSYIFAGPADLGKTTIARHFAKLLLCHKRNAGDDLSPCGDCPSCRSMRTGSGGAPENGLGFIHGDFIQVKLEEGKKNISVAQIREIISGLNMSSFLNSYKIALVKDADSLSEEAANAFLKTLEEPKSKVVAILTVKSLSSLPQTIVSRSQVLSFNPVSTDEIYEYLVSEYGADRVTAKAIARLAMGRPALAVKYFEDGAFLEKHASAVRLYLACQDVPAYKRLRLAEEELGAKPDSLEVRTLLDSWKGIVRDGLLAAYGHYDLVQNENFSKEARKLGKHAGVRDLLDAINLLDRSGEYLRANVNPKTVLENVVMSL